MANIIGVNFRNGGKIYYFSPGENEVRTGQKVIVETSRGIEMGTVILGLREMDDEKIEQPLKEIMRVAAEEDFLRVEENKKKEKEALVICQEKIEKHGLAMKLIACEYTFENNKILFYFTADGRIDFRELVKDLASVFRTRIELRQIGVRDETKILGGIGICGRELCCKSFLTGFVPVSIRMAKEQNLSLNPTKISGTCGRLMCCLKNEEETYEYLNARLPVVGEFVLHKSDNTHGKVYSVDVLRQKVKVVVSLPGDDLEVREYPVEELRFKPRAKHTNDLDEMELTDEQRALDEELSRVEAEHAEAEAAAAVSASANQEKIEAAHRRENNAYQQAIKMVRENDAAEKAEREERAARYAAVSERDNIRRSSRADLINGSNTRFGDSTGNRRNQQQYQKYGSDTYEKSSVYDKYQSSRVRGNDKDGRNQPDNDMRGLRHTRNNSYARNNENYVDTDYDSKRNPRGGSSHGHFSQGGYYPANKERWSKNKDNWKRKHESFHSQKKRNGLRYSSRKNMYNPATDHRDDE